MYDNGFTERVDIDKLAVQVANLQTEKLKANNSDQQRLCRFKSVNGYAYKRQPCIYGYT